MFPLRLPYDAASPLNILCSGAHSDVIAIGCVGTTLHLARQYPKSVFHWVVFSALGVRAAELFAGTNPLQETRDFLGSLHLVLAGGRKAVP